MAPTKERRRAQSLDASQAACAAGEAMVDLLARLPDEGRRGAAASWRRSTQRGRSTARSCATRATRYAGTGWTWYTGARGGPRRRRADLTLASLARLRGELDQTGPRAVGRRIDPFT